MWLCNHIILLPTPTLYNRYCVSCSAACKCLHLPLTAAFTTLHFAFSDENTILLNADATAFSKRRASRCCL